MTIIFIEGNVSTSSYEKACSDNNLAPLSRKCIFIFPGNESHHTNRHTLFSVKGGSGLAAASAAIGKAGYPTLSLPTTDMEEWESDSQQQETVLGALYDLYKAVGAGYHLIMPVRGHYNTKYFDQGLFPEGICEPNFWGGIQKTPNKPLANYYTQQLDDLYRFLALSVESRDKKAQADSEHPLYQAYLQGQQMGADDPWLKSASIQGHNTKPAAPQKTAGTSGLFLPQKQNALKDARELLNGYTQNNSALKRFFTGHWNRHHVVEVNRLVVQIDKGQIKDIAELIKRLDEIKLVNSRGSLARRISAIKDMRAEEISFGGSLSRR